MQSTTQSSTLYNSARTGMWRRLGIIVLMVVVVQAVGATITASSVTSWYPTLYKATWNPPAWVFGPVWTVLYVLMAWAGWRVWQCLIAQGEARPWSHPALRSFAIQLVFNLGWSCIFLGLQQPVLAMLEMLLLFISIVWMLHSFSRVDRLAFYSQLPYALWVAFAFTLNAAIVSLNG